MSKTIKRHLIEKLLKVCETSEASIIEKYARSSFGDLFQQLTEDNALINFKTLKSVCVPDGDDEGNYYDTNPLLLSQQNFPNGVYPINVVFFSSKKVALSLILFIIIFLYTLS